MTRISQSRRLAASVLLAATTLAAPAHGQLLDPSRWLPKVAPGDFVSIGAGFAHACATRADGTTLCWGNNRFGQIGPIGTQTCGPNKVPCEKQARMLLDVQGQPLLSAPFSVGWNHNCALGKGTGEVRCLGSNAAGQLGTGPQRPEDHQEQPTPVAGKLWFTSVSAGVDSTCGIVGGALYCWGNLAAGFVAQGALPHGAQTVPSPIAGVSGAAGALATGKSHVCLAFGKPSWPDWLCLGLSVNGVFGEIPGVTVSSWKVLPETPWTNGQDMAWATRAHFNCIDLWGFQVECAGDNSVGQLGAGHTAFTLDPQRVGGGQSLSGVTVGGSHACAIDTYAQAWCWGSGTRGELGDGRTATSSWPVLVAGGALRFRALAAGDGFTCGIGEDNSLYCWGAASQGQLGGRFYANAGWSATPLMVEVQR